MEITPARSLEGNKTEVIYKNKLPNGNIAYRYFSVDNEKCDEFISAFKKQHRNFEIASIIGTLANIAVVTLTAYKLPVKSTWTKCIAAIGAGFALPHITLPIAGNYIEKQQKNLIKKYGGEEHTYLGNKDSIEILENKSDFAPVK